MPQKDAPSDLVQGLIAYIRGAGLTAGDRLPSIRTLAAKLNASPSAVRDAMMQAQTMGLVRVRARAGAFVQSPNYAPLVEALTNTLDTTLLQVDHNLFHLLEARQLLEVELIAQAARRRRLEDLLPVRDALIEMSHLLSQPIADNENRRRFVDADVRFHLGIAESAGNPVLVTILKSLLELLRPHLVCLPWDDQRRSQTEASHRGLYEALVRGDVNAARQQMVEHLSMAYDSLLKEIQMIPKI